MSSGRRGGPSPMDACGDHRLAALARGRLPPAFTRWTVTVAPGACHPYLAAEWTDALVLVVSGEIVLEGVAGPCWRLATGATLWLADLPLARLRNPGAEPAVLVAL